MAEVEADLKVIVSNCVESACGDACRSQRANIEKVQALLAEVHGLTDQVQFIAIANNRVDAPGLHAFLREDGSGHRNWIVLREEVSKENRTSERAKSDESVLARGGPDYSYRDRR